jgi:integrase
MAAELGRLRLSGCGGKPLASIDTADMQRMLARIWTEKPPTAGRVRARVEAILDAAKVHGLRDGENPARWKGHLENIFPKLTKVATVQHHAAMPYADVAAFMARLREQTGASDRALEFAILTAVRTSEALNATWAEIDLDQRVWTIPASRMKAKRDHRVPLSDRALAVLQDMAAVRQGDYVFSFRPGRPLTKTVLQGALGRMGAAVTAHGFRSTFRDWAGDHGFPREVAEAALAHVMGDATEQAYARSDALARRAVLMAAWASYCEGEAGGKVTPLHAVA